MTFVLLQANQTGGSSTNMELEGCKRSFSFLISSGQSLGTFISDRHRGIAKWIKECYPTIKHFYDLWHVARSVTKAMLKASKENGCSIIKEWMTSIRNHLYWCVTSTKEGFGDMIVAKWKSITRHIANKHTDHEGTLYKKCGHKEITEDREWIKNGNNIIMVIMVINGIIA